MNGPTRTGRTDIMTAWMAMAGVAALLMLSVQVGCGSPSSASPSASLASKPAPGAKPEVSTPAASAVEATPAEISPTKTIAESSPVSASNPADNIASENPGSNVRPMTVALVQTERAAEPVRKSKPAAETPKKPVDPNRTNNYSFDDLKFDIEKDAPFERSMLPKKIEEYAGQRVSIRGFILPTSFATGLTSFVLVRDNMECCFGPGAALYDCIVIEMAEGKTTDYSIRPVTVEGKFSIDEFIGPNRRHLAIYKIVADKVE
jgi:hypothetical protein